LDEKSTAIAVLKDNNEKLNSTVKDLSERLHLAEQNMRESNLEVNGVPEHKAENLSNVIVQLAKTVNCPVQVDDVYHAVRVAKMNKQSDKPRTIIVKMRNSRLRDSVLAAVSRFNKNNPNEIQNTNTNNLFVNIGTT
jgi:hypothetical protein